MGINVLEPDSNGWIVGSFSGLYFWDRNSDSIIDLYTEKPIIPRKPGKRTIFNNLVNGFIKDFNGNNIMFEHDKGSKVLSIK